MTRVIVYLWMTQNTSVLFWTVIMWIGCGVKSLTIVLMALSLTFGFTTFLIPARGYLVGTRVRQNTPVPYGTATWCRVVAFSSSWDSAHLYRPYSAATQGDHTTGTTTLNHIILILKSTIKWLHSSYNFILSTG